MHVEWGIRALIVYLDSNYDNVCMLGEFIGGTQAPDELEHSYSDKSLWVISLDLFWKIHECDCVL